MGGTRRADTNGYPNLLDLCNACHSWIESYRTAALDDGWLVRQRSDPAAVPVLYRGYQAWLREDGGVDYLTAEEIAARRSAA